MCLHASCSGRAEACKHPKLLSGISLPWRLALNAAEEFEEEDKEEASNPQLQLPHGHLKKPKLLRSSCISKMSMRKLKDKRPCHTVTLHPGLKSNRPGKAAS